MINAWLLYWEYPPVDRIMKAVYAEAIAHRIVTGL